MITYKTQCEFIYFYLFVFNGRLEAHEHTKHTQTQRLKKTKTNYFANI